MFVREAASETRSRGHSCAHLATPGPTAHVRAGRAAAPETASSSCSIFRRRTRSFARPSARATGASRSMQPRQIESLRALTAGGALKPYLAAGARRAGPRARRDACATNYGGARRRAIRPRAARARATARRLRRRRDRRGGAQAARARTRCRARPRAPAFAASSERRRVAQTARRSHGRGFS